MRSLSQLTENTIAIYSRIKFTDITDSDELDNYCLMGDIVNYVNAVSLYMFAADGDVSDEELDLLIAFNNEVEGIGSGLPSDNHFRWAEARIQETPDFLKLAAIAEQTGSGTATTVLWHIKNIIMTLIDADAKIDPAEIDEGKLLLLNAENTVAAYGVNSDTDLYDFAPSLVAAFTAKRESETPESLEGEENVESLINELNSMAGLEGIKAEVATLVNLVKVRSLRESRGLKMPDISLHMVFSGRPGTGKTTIGRLLGRIYKALGVLSKGHLVEVDRSSLVAGYVGQTAIKCKEALEKANGGILFIDEAYTLSRSSENDYGQEAIDTILKYMEDHRDELVVIAAGYENEMAQFVSSNPGLQSRFNKFLTFEDYSISQLYEIFLKLAESHHYYYDEKVAQIIYDNLERLKDLKADRFSNARDVRNSFESIVQAQANRIATEGEGDDETAIYAVLELDIKAAFQRIL